MLADLQIILSNLKIYDLTQPLYDGIPIHPADPPFMSTIYVTHEKSIKHFAGGFSYSLEIVTTSMHSGTHIDALCHIGENLKLHGGLSIDDVINDENKYKMLGSDKIPIMLLNTILVDIAGLKEVEMLPAEHGITSEEIKEALRKQKIVTNDAEAVVIRTGYGKFFQETKKYLTNHAGLTIEAAKWLTENFNRLKVVGADNLALEVLPTNTYPVHRYLLVHKGIYTLKNLYLEELANSGINTFLMIIAPLKIIGVTGSLIRVFAIG